MFSVRDGESGQCCGVLELEGHQYTAWPDFWAQLPVGRCGAQRLDPA